MSESQILAKVRLKASKLHYTLWRNNIGAYMDAKGHWIKYGVCNPGGSDLIGYREITITPDMVGKKIAQFCAIEVKTPNGKIKKEQALFLSAINLAGGVAYVARSEDDVSYPPV